jgi:serine-type D-Ala-D-Ala carboxypeptidase/endopeptidase
MKHLTLTLTLTSTLTLACASPDRPSMTDGALAGTVAKRFAGDRTGACIAAAVIDRFEGSQSSQISRALVCADPSAKQQRALDGQTAFEIGSVSKTMTAMLLADLIDQGKLAIDDPVAQHLPAGTRVPSFAGAPIRLAHLVTHTSGLPGLPSRLTIADPDNPYASFTEDELLASLGDIPALMQAPGSHYAYSNFGGMLLSYVVARTAGTDFESLLRERLLAPLDMREAFVASKPGGVRVAAGHLPTGEVTSPWEIPVNLAGVGGVRASLEDMIRYAAAQVGGGDARVVRLMAETHRRVALGPAAGPDVPEMAMAWFRAPLSGRTVLAHDGGTGGFSTQVVLDDQADPERGHRRAVVVLSDTTLTSLGGAQDLALHLLDASFPMEEPRTVAQAPADLLAALAGRYRLEDLGVVELRTREGKLFGQADGDDELEFGYDSHGDFFPLGLDALLTPRRVASGAQSFVWTQGSVAVMASRLDSGGAPGGPLPPVDLADYRGEYPLTPTFVLTIFDRDGLLYVQGTGQEPVPLAPAGKDVFVAESVDAELTFERDASGRVQAVTLRQAGRTLRGMRTPGP